MTAIPPPSYSDSERNPNRKNDGASKIFLCNKLAGADGLLLGPRKNHQIGAHQPQQSNGYMGQPNNFHIASRP